VGYIELVVGRNAGARPRARRHPSVPRRRSTQSPHLPAVRMPSRRGTRVGHRGWAHSPALARPRDRPRALPSAEPRSARHRRLHGHSPCPERLGPASRANWLACTPLGTPDAPRNSPSLTLLRRRTAPLPRVRRRRRA
jgi:hypothetical protein